MDLAMLVCIGLGLDFLLAVALGKFLKERIDVPGPSQLAASAVGTKT
jgi:hypothetical protein